MLFMKNHREITAETKVFCITLNRVAAVHVLMLLHSCSCAKLVEMYPSSCKCN